MHWVIMQVINSFDLGLDPVAKKDVFIWKSINNSQNLEKVLTISHIVVKLSLLYMLLKLRGGKGVMSSCLN